MAHPSAGGAALASRWQRSRDGIVRRRLAIPGRQSYHSAMRIPSLLLCLALVLANVPGAHAVTSFSAEYELSRGIVTLGQMTRRLRLDGQRYRYESRMIPRGLVALFAKDGVTEVSSGRLESDRFVPERYEYDKGGTRKDFALDFDYASATVALTAANRSWRAELPAGALDRLVYQVQFMLDLPHAPATLDYIIADKGKLKHYHIVNAGSEMVDTPLGRFETVKLQRAKPDSAYRTTVWCAAALDWMPVKVEYRDDDGAVTVATLKTLERG